MGCLVRSGLVLCVLQGRISCNVIMKIKTRHRMDGRQRSVVLRHGRCCHTPLTESLLRRVHRAFMAISGYFFLFFLRYVFFLSCTHELAAICARAIIMIITRRDNGDSRYTCLSCVCRVVIIPLGTRNNDMRVRRRGEHGGNKKKNERRREQNTKKNSSTTRNDIFI